MTSNEVTGADDTGTTTEGAIKGGDGNYFFHSEGERDVGAGSRFSPARGTVVEGERHQGGVMTMEAGTGADPHTHPHEQFIYVTRGELRMRVAGEETVLTDGSFAYVPPDTVHEVDAVGDEDVHFFTTKDLSRGSVEDQVT